MLACLVLPQQAAAQNSLVLGGTTYTIADADPVDEGGTARFEITIDPTGVDLGVVIRYTAGSAELADLGSERPSR